MYVHIYSIHVYRPGRMAFENRPLRLTPDSEVQSLIPALPACSGRHEGIFLGRYTRTRPPDGSREVKNTFNNILVTATAPRGTAPQRGDAASAISAARTAFAGPTRASRATPEAADHRPSR